MQTQNSSNRRRRPLLTNAVHIATAAVVTYGTYQLATWAWNEWWNASDHEDDEQQTGRRPTAEQEPVASRSARSTPRSGDDVKQQQTEEDDMIRHCRKKVWVAIQEVLPILSSSFDEQTNVSQETQQLKRLRQDKLAVESDTETLAAELEQESSQLWNRIKIKLMTRLIATAYVHTLYWLLFIVQEHVSMSQGMNVSSLLTRPSIVVSQLVEKVKSVVESELLPWDVTSVNVNVVAPSSSSPPPPPCSPSKMDTSLEGSDSLLNTTTTTTSNSSSSANVGCLLTRHDFQSGIDAVRRVMEGRRSFSFTSSPTSPLQEWIESNTDVFSCSSDIRHVIQSPLFESTMKQCLDVTFATLERCGWIQIFCTDFKESSVHGQVKPSSPATTTTSRTKKLHLSQKYTAPLPLAKILAQIKRSIQDTFYVPVVSTKLESSNSSGISMPFPNECIKAMNSLDIVLELAIECLNL